MGRGAGRGRLRGVRDQPDVGGPVSGAALHLGGEDRCRRRARAGRDRAAGPRRTTGRSPATPPDAEAVKLVARTHQIADLGPHPPRAAAAHGAAGVLPGRAGGLRRSGRTRHPRAARPGAGPRPGGPADPRAIAAALRGPTGGRRGQGRPQLQDVLRRRQLRQPAAGAERPTPRSWPARSRSSPRSTPRSTSWGRWWPSILADTGTLRSTSANPASAWSSAPGSSASSATTRTATPTPRPQELRRHLPDHPRLRHQEGRARPLRPQPPARRRPAPVGVLLAERLTRRPRLLPAAPRPRHRPPGRPAPARATASSASSTAASRPSTTYDEHTAWSHHIHDRRLTPTEPGMSAADSVRSPGSAPTACALRPFGHAARRFVLTFCPRWLSSLAGMSSKSERGPHGGRLRRITRLVWPNSSTG